MDGRRITTSAFVLIFTTLLVLTPSSIRADIGGRTTIQCLQRNTDVTCESRLQQFRNRNVVAGSSVGASFLEAFIDSMQMLKNIYDAVTNIVAQNYAAAAVEMYGAYDEALQLGDSTGDKQAVEQVYVGLDQSAPYDRVNLTFDVWSDDDTFQDLKVAAPIVKYRMAQPDPGTLARTTGANMIAAVRVGPIQGGRGQRTGQVTVTLTPKRMPIGRYPIVLSIKEDNCSVTCLSIIHVIQISVYKTCRLTPNGGCDIISKRWSALQLELLDQKTNWYGLFADFRRNDRVRFRYCGPNIIGRQQPVGCNPQFDERFNEGSCPELSAGLSQSACDRARPILDRMRAIETELATLADQMIRQNCCHEVINPSGGNGVPGRELDVKTHGDKPHTDKPHVDKPHARPHTDKPDPNIHKPAEKPKSEDRPD